MLAPVVWKNFRDRQNAPALLESVRETSGVHSKSRSGEIRALEARSFSSIAPFRRTPERHLRRAYRDRLPRDGPARRRHDRLVLDRNARGIQPLPLLTMVKGTFVLNIE